MNTTYDLLKNTALKFSDKIAIGSIVNGEEQSITFGQLKQQADICASNLLQMGLKKGDKVVIVTYNRAEWYVLDNALSQIGVIGITAFPNYNYIDLDFIIDQTNAPYIFVADKLILQIIRNVSSSKVALSKIISFSPVDGVADFKQLLNGELTADNRRQLEAANHKVTSEDIYTIFYTSGTGGQPKGVVTTHRGVVAGGIATAEALEVQPDDKAISFLSIAHTYERGHYLAYLYSGTPVFIAERTISPIESLKNIQPTIFVTVPAILLRIYEAVIQQFKLDSSHEALKYALYFDPHQEDSKVYQQYFTDYFSEWRQVISPSIRVIVSSGGSLPEHIARFYYALQYPVQEIYGSSECFCITFSKRPDALKFGTVGKPAKGVSLKLNDDGEIMCKSPYLFLGYCLPNNEIDKNVFDKDGYYPTGDLGEWVEGEFLRISGRKMDSFKISSGYYILPDKVQSELNQLKSISHSIVYGDNGSIVAIIQPNLAILKEIFSDDQADEMDKDRIEQYIRSEIDTYYNDSKVREEQIKQIKIDYNQWTIGDGSLTPTMKFKRLTIINKNK